MTRAEDGLIQWAFSADAAGSPVPALAWLPPLGSNERPPPVVLLGHGGTGHKGMERHHRLAHRLVKHGIAALAIDGPFHGDRAALGDGPLSYQQQVIAAGPLSVHQHMQRDWLAALAVLAENHPINQLRVGFLGVSMGARYGLAVCAELGPRLKAAVIAKFGLVSPDETMTAMGAPELNRACAAAITAPVLHHVQWDDEVFTRAGQLDLFDCFASRTKLLRARPGPHTVTRDDDEDAWLRHLITKLSSHGDEAATACWSRNPRRVMLLCGVKGPGAGVVPRPFVGVKVLRPLRGRAAPES